MRAWMIRAGRNGEREEAALTGDRAIAGWDETGDLAPFDDRTSLRDYLRTVYPEASPALLANWTGQLWRFIAEIAIGDLVVMPCRSGEQPELAVGEVISGYFFDAEAADGFRHCIGVKWLQRVERSVFERDLLDSMGALLTIFELRRHDAAKRVADVAAGGEDPGWRAGEDEASGIATIDDLVARVTSSTGPIEMSIRQILGLWGVERRTDSSVALVEQGLADEGLVVTPGLSQGWLDNAVRVAEVDAQAATRADAQSSLGGLEEVRPAPVSVTISTLPSARSAVTAVGVNDTLELAITLLLQHDYSQLPVLNENGDIVGIVSWETIGKARLSKDAPALVDATAPARTVTLDAELLGVVSEVATRDFVLVRASDSYKAIGIVTVADLSRQFQIMARPFALIEEIERRLRRRVDERVPLAAMQAAVGNAKAAAKIEGAASLTMGNYKHLLASEETFRLLGWPLDHDRFFQLLCTVHKMRNNLMHFSTDPVEEPTMKEAQAFLEILRTVDPRQ
ncbi:CBS domain-containing protein [Cellulomonas marina]|uniref:Restriction system protein n=1 Tax=Cellulomonas marina TaxID=988821 RepID=A0A1I0Y5B6_9CELL|nr:CBS domain-containing protein [Cellulomonas marina]GIG29805.1 hypothetical protein Cma02nite_24050 [Cellulomonas marina]SFB08469.1 restriction system protein [Cellulomonas marina]